MSSTFRTPGTADEPRRYTPRVIGRIEWTFCILITLAAGVFLTILWIGDISFLQDEPRQLAKAFHCNAAGQLESRGLNGNFGVPYGPLPTQIYQLIMLFTHDPITIATVRAGVCAAAMALGLLWLARSLRLNPWFATAVVIAPYVWNFNRIMWDASFAIPIGCAALGAYASFLRHQNRWALFVAVFCVLFLVFIHPQDGPLLAPIALHMVWKRHRALAKHYIGIAVILGITFALNRGYIVRAYYAASWQAHHGDLSKGYPGNPQSHGASMLNAFRGGSMLEGSRFAYRDAQMTEPAKILWIAQAGSRLAYALIWAGMVIAAVRFVLRLMHRNDGEGDDPDDPTLLSARRAMFGIALAGLVMHIALCGAMRLVAEPQYYFGTLGLQILFAWIAIDAMARFKYLDWLAIAIYGVCSVYITIAGMMHIHRVGYARGTFRPSLVNQVQIAKELNRYADPIVYTDVQMYQAFPQAIRSLRLLLPPERNQTQIAGKTLLIRNRSGPQGTDSAIELVEVLPGQSIDKTHFEPLDITSLPPDWQPAKW